MKHGLLPLVLLLLLGGCDSSRSSPVAASAPEIGITDATMIRRHYREVGGLWEREYELTVRGTGEVALRTKIGAHSLGEPEQWEVPRDTVARLMSSISRSGFLDLPADVGKPLGPGSVHSMSSITTVDTPGLSKTVIRQIGGEITPDASTLRELERRIETEVGAEPRIRERCFQGSEQPLP